MIVKNLCFIIPRHGHVGIQFISAGCACENN